MMEKMDTSSFLMGQPYAELQGDSDGKGKFTAAKRYKKLTEISRIFWAKLIAELSRHLNQYNNCIAETRGLKLGDIALLLDPKKRGMFPLVRITNVQRGINSKVRIVTVFDGSTHFPRAITSLATLVPADKVENETDEKTTKDKVSTTLSAKLSGN
jgi:hypothetical protein